MNLEQQCELFRWFARAITNGYMFEVVERAAGVELRITDPDGQVAAWLPRGICQDVVRGFRESGNG